MIGGLCKNSKIDDRYLIKKQLIIIRGNVIDFRIKSATLKCKQKIQDDPEFIDNFSPYNTSLLFVNGVVMFWMNQLYIL